MLNDGIHHLLEAEILVCWERASQSTDIPTFINKALSCAISKIIHDHYCKDWFPLQVRLSI